MDIDFEALFGASPNPYVLLDRDFVIVAMNDAYLRVTMRERADIIGRRMFDAFPSDPDSPSFQLLHNSLERVLETGERDELALIRYDIEDADGGFDERYWSATHVPLHDKDGGVAFILQHTVDVTELHRLRQMAEQVNPEEAKVFQRARGVQEANLSLTEESHRLRQFLEQAPGFVAVLSGPEHRFEMANAAYRRLVGHRDVIGKPLVEALPEVIDQGFANLLDQVMANGEPYVGRAVRVFLESSADGVLEENFLDFIYQPISGPDGHVSGVFVQGHDVTEQQRATAALRESEERFRLVADSAPVMLWMGDTAGKCVYLNRAQREFWGVEPDAIPGFDWGGTIHPDDAPAVAARAIEAMTAHQPFDVEARYRRSDGAYRLLHTDAQPRFNAAGEFLGMIGVNLDLTEARQAEEHQQLLINELNHRVKNTLAIVQALAMQSFGDGIDPATARKTFDARLNALSAAHNLLTAQNWESAGLFETIRASVAATAGANAHRVRLEGPDTQLSPQTAVSLAMAIHELCTNAIKYGALSNEDGTVQVRWTTEADADEAKAITIIWTESGGPSVTPPAHRGFGTRLIQRGLSAELSSKAVLEFRPEGLRCTIEARLPAA